MQCPDCGSSHNRKNGLRRAKQNHIPDAYDPEVIPQVGELNELEAFVGSKNKIWLWTAVDHFTAGILGWVLGDTVGRPSSPCGRSWQRGSATSRSPFA
jgi:hypothetical protein